MEQEKKLIRIKPNTTVPGGAGAIVGAVKEGYQVEVRALGAGAVNQMFKALARARGTLALQGKDLYVKPGFDTVNDDNGNELSVVVAYIVIM